LVLGPGLKNMKNACLLIMVLGVIVLPMTAIADTPPDYNDSLERMNSFMENVSVVLNNILADAELSGFVDALWSALTVILIFTALSKYSMGGVTVFELIHPLLLIVVTRIMLNNYDYLTSICWDWSEGIAGGIQRAVIGSADPFLLPGFIHDVVAGIETSDISIFAGIKLVLASNLILAIIFLLSLLAFLANTWALWGYAMSKIIGVFFIPFIMVKRLSYLFDGWVRLFSGFLVYGIIARANLLLTVLAVKAFFGIPGYTANTASTIRIDFDGIADLFGLAAFLSIAILALISTGRFATAVVSGAGGFGDSVRSVAFNVSKILKGF
jgi:hypothetical protein